MINIIIFKEIRDKIIKNDIKPDEMKEYLYQKIYFEESFKQYLTMTYNQILLSLIEKYKVKKIEYNNKNFSVFKNSLKKPLYKN